MRIIFSLMKRNKSMKSKLLLFSFILFTYNVVNGQTNGRTITESYNLSKNEIRLCTFLKMNLSSKEIAPMMNISFRGVELHRYRLRKKLGIAQEETLSKFLLSI